MKGCPLSALRHGCPDNARRASGGVERVFYSRGRMHQDPVPLSRGEESGSVPRPGVAEPGSTTGSACSLLARCPLPGRGAPSSLRACPEPKYLIGHERSSRRVRAVTRRRDPRTAPHREAPAVGKHCPTGAPDSRGCPTTSRAQLDCALRTPGRRTHGPIPGRLPTPPDRQHGHRAHALASLEPAEPLLWVQRQEHHRIAAGHDIVTPPEHRAGQDPRLAREEDLLHERDSFGLRSLLDVRRIARHPEVVIRVSMRHGPLISHGSCQGGGAGAAGAHHVEAGTEHRLIISTSIGRASRAAVSAPSTRA